MERISRLGIVGPLVILGVGAAVVIGVLVVLHPDNTVAAAIIAAAATILTTALTVTVGCYFEKERELDAQAREKKIPIYEDFNEFIFRALMWQKMGIRMAERGRDTGIVPRTVGSFEPRWRSLAPSGQRGDGLTSAGDRRL